MHKDSDKYKNKTYDDDLLVRLIADPRVPNRRIADEVGIGPSMVRRITAGKYRPELQPLIDAELRKRLRKERHKAAGMDLTEDPQGQPYRRTGYDDNLLVELLGRGDLTLAEIGRRVGVTDNTVRRVLRGKMRPELQPRIRRAIKDHAAHVRLTAHRRLEALVNRHIHTGLAGDGELARKCREFVLKLIWCGPSASDEPHELPRPGLTAEDYRAIALLKGGPTDDEPVNGGTGDQGPGTGDGGQAAPGAPGEALDGEPAGPAGADRVVARRREPREQETHHTPQEPPQGAIPARRDEPVSARASTRHAGDGEQHADSYRLSRLRRRQRRKGH